MWRIYYKPNTGVIVYATDNSKIARIELPFIESEIRIDITDKIVNLETLTIEPAVPTTVICEVPRPEKIIKRTINFNL
jgi:hypothetical protein